MNTRAPVRTANERGTALFLVPAFLVIIIMAAGFAIDWSIAFLSEREAAHAASAAANDAAGAAVSKGSFQTGATIEINESQAIAVAEEAVAARASKVLQGIHVETSVEGTTVTVIVTAKVATVFSRGLPFVGDTIDVRARASATPHEGGPGRA